VVGRGDVGVSDARMEAVIGRLHHVIVDCPDPAALAAFYSELLGLPITWQVDDFVESHRRLSESLVIDPPSLSNPDTSASAVCRDGCCATVEIISPCRFAATIVIFMRSTAS
jgi:hypothetical protein